MNKITSEIQLADKLALEMFMVLINSSGYFMGVFLVP